MARGLAEVQVYGLDQFRRAIRRVDDGLGKALGQAHKTLGELIIARSESRRSRMASRFPSYRADVVKVKPSANQRRMQVTVRPAAAETGIRRHPVFGVWMDQTEFRRRVWPAENRSGWLIRPTINENRPQIANEYLDAVAALARREGFEVT